MTIEQLINVAKTRDLGSSGNIKNDTDSVLNYINLALIELYKRFPLSTKECVIALQDNTELYDLPSDCMWIVKAYGEVKEGSIDVVNILPINEEDNPLSINTVSFNQIQVPVNVSGSFISIIYQASPKWYTSSDMSEIVPIPPQFIEPLLQYVGYSGHLSVNAEMSSENSTHYTRFEASCKRIEERGMYNTDDLNMDARNMKGFV